MTNYSITATENGLPTKRLVMFTVTVRQDRIVMPTSVYGSSITTAELESIAESTRRGETSGHTGKHEWRVWRIT